MRPIAIFTIATLIPIPLLTLAALFGGVWVVVAWIYMTVFTYLLDQLVAVVPLPVEGEEFPAGDLLSVVLAVAHFGLLGVSIHAIGTAQIGLWSSVGLIIALGLYFGQVSNSNAHELIHKGRRSLNLLGRWVYISMLYGHHVSAHVLIHHRLVATPDDPATARLGEGYWSYVPRAWAGSFRMGYTAEQARLDRVGRGHMHNPYVVYILGGLGFCVAAVAIGGLRGLAAYLLLAAYAQVQLLLSDYVQHYGLTRSTIDGKPEPVGPRHSWNAPQWFSGALMLNAPRHSDHHAHPARPFPALRLDSDAPILPRSLPAMASLALVPPLWRRVMDRRVQRVMA
ncbi:alkane 1-monooxygenase [Loktanella sp. SALINAS62]|uniref:alkane 1-monooxygenase n=1 Tax=Loktanella sp. SALINAS62 TaxID=2706124 RepID=UPI001B8B1B46|nr:alkane 1-monooxygenase [Loktanella sp. SALINAS62]MBS1303007.1 alkane 1-monooxygenase [Loktanella sp. SALINAS62]